MKWLGTRPETCDVCSCPTEEEDYFVDGKTTYGPWGIMCPTCFNEVGIGLGPGKGQKYDVETLEKIGG